MTRKTTDLLPQTYFAANQSINGLSREKAACHLENSPHQAERGNGKANQAPKYDCENALLQNHVFDLDRLNCKPDRIRGLSGPATAGLSFRKGN